VSAPTLTEIRAALEGLAPVVVATSSADGVPNVAYVSQLQYVDADHVGISNQFLSKTKRNLAEHPRAVAFAIHPETARSYRLRLRFERSETEGERFDAMQARLDLIASMSHGAPHSLRSLDVFVVEGIEPQASDKIGDEPSDESSDDLAPDGSADGGA